MGDAGNKFPIVGIGSSAGGLEAFVDLLSKVPLDTGMAFILVQHLDPKRPSLSAGIISRATKLETQEVKDGTRVLPNQIYVIPSNHNMEIQEKVLHLSKRIESAGQNRAIDLFFKSLAQSEKNCAIGIVLSGTGGDGTEGLQSIKDEGGMTYAQNPTSAKFEGMPLSAIAAGVADLVMTPGEIARDLTTKAHHPYLIPQKKQSKSQVPNINIPTISTEASHPSPDLLRIFSLLRTHTKVDFADYKHTTVKRRIQRRMMVHRSKSLKEYVKYLQTNDEEVHALYNDLLINVTDFFRDPTSFRSLNTQVFPALVKSREPDAAIRIWVAGCSTGEEVYSLAISLLEYLDQIGKKYPIQFFATDISEVAIQKARRGEYPDNIAGQISKQRLEKYFEKIPGGYKIQKEIRDLCLFSKHDITADAPFAKLDLISCRNVLIYFTTALQKRVMPLFHYALQQKGLLWLGKSENPGEPSKLFTSIDDTHKIYGKLGVSTPLTIHFPAKPPRESLEPPKKRPDFVKPEFSFQKDADNLILTKFAPPGVVVNSHLEILQFRGRTIPYLEPSPGQPSFHLLKMARSELSAGLRTTAGLAIKKNKAISKKDIHIEIDGRMKILDIEVHPINPNAQLAERTFLVLFKEKSDLKSVKSRKVSIGKKLTTKKDLGSQQLRIDSLLSELSETKKYQQSLIEQYETTQEQLTSANDELQSTNEEFQSTNEEFQSTNEEFQSTNEEMETAKEELQSTNEELVTVNDELQIRNTDLMLLSGDLNNLLASIEIPVLITGADHRIRRFSPMGKNPFNLIPTDIGRPLGDIKPSFDLNLDSMVTLVTDNLNQKEIEVQDHEGSWLRVQVRPYRTIDNKIDGAIITLMDIDVLKKKQQTAKDEIASITSIAEAVPLPLAVVNTEFQFSSANQPFYKYFQVSEEFGGKDMLITLNIHGTAQKRLRELFTQTIKENKPFSDFEVDCDIPRLGSRKLFISGGNIKWTGNESTAVLLSFVDITERRRLEEDRRHLYNLEQQARTEAEKANRAKDIFLATVSHELRTPLSAILTWSQLISQGKVDFEKAKQGALVIEQSAKAQNHLIEDLLDISRIILGKVTLEIRKVDPSIVILSAIESVHSMAEKKSIKIKTLLSSESELIHADPLRLEQIVSNLLTNAIKFSPNNSQIEVGLEYIGELSKRLAQIKVTDHGNGIPPEFIPHIFDRFSQADGASTRIHGGLGLGLSIVHNLVELHLGEIKVENAPEQKGAIFTVTFPMISGIQSAIVQTEHSDQEELGRETVNDRKAMPKLDGLKILFVDDDEGTREATNIYLKSFGAEVVAVESVKEALLKLPFLKPDILVSDIAMPGEDGYSLIRKIRKLEPSEGGNIPALALTAYTTSEDVQNMLQAGFQTHVAKPVEANVLGRTILRLIANHKK